MGLYVLHSTTCFEDSFSWRTSLFWWWPVSTKNLLIPAKTRTKQNSSSARLQRQADWKLRFRLQSGLTICNRTACGSILYSIFGVLLRKQVLILKMTLLAVWPFFLAVASHKNMQNLNNPLKVGRGIRMIVNNCILLCDDHESGLPHRCNNALHWLPQAGGRRCGALTGSFNLKRQVEGRRAGYNEDWLCVWKTRWLSGLDSTAWLDLLYSVLLWQAIIRQKAGTDVGDNWVGGRGRKTATKMEAQKKRVGASCRRKWARRRGDKRRRGRQSRSEGCLVCLFSSSAPSLMRLAWQEKNATLGNSGHMKIG